MRTAAARGAWGDALKAAKSLQVPDPMRLSVGPVLGAAVLTMIVGATGLILRVMKALPVNAEGSPIQTGLQRRTSS
jgi:hypothetical protein